MGKGEEQTLSELLDIILKEAYGFDETGTRYPKQSEHDVTIQAIKAVIESEVNKTRIEELEKLRDKVHAPSLQPLTIDFHIEDRIEELRGNK